EHLDLEPIDLPRLVSHCVETFRGTAQANGIDLQLTISPTRTTTVSADEDRLRHVVRSILGNALKFTPPSGWVRVEVGSDPQTGRALRVSISDSGIGLRKEQLGRVWDRFYQGDPSLTRPYGGMGLGLSIARHLVALHGGTVGAESSGPGQGSTFWFTL